MRGIVTRAVVNNQDFITREQCFEAAPEAKGVVFGMQDCGDPGHGSEQFRERVYAKDLRCQHSGICKNRFISPFSEVIGDACTQETLALFPAKKPSYNRFNQFLSLMQGRGFGLAVCGKGIFR